MRAEPLLQRWRMPTKLHPLKSVQYFYEDGPYLIFIYEKKHRTAAWIWSVYKEGEEVAHGRDHKLYHAKYHSVKTMEKFDE